MLDALLDLEIGPVDVVVERDHVVGELDVALGERVERPPQHAQDEGTFRLEARLELVELFLER